MKGEKTLQAKANREVLLCGGSFNSPQLLQLSGVGPRALLEEHGIPVVLDAPEVGEGLQDHFYCRTFWRCQQADHAERRHDEPVAAGEDRPATTSCSAAGRSPSAPATPPPSCARGRN